MSVNFTVIIQESMSSVCIASFGAIHIKDFINAGDYEAIRKKALTLVGDDCKGPEFIHIYAGIEDEKSGHITCGREINSKRAYTKYIHSFDKDFDVYIVAVVPTRSFTLFGGKQPEVWNRSTLEH